MIALIPFRAHFSLSGARARDAGRRPMTMPVAGSGGARVGSE